MNAKPKEYAIIENNLLVVNEPMSIYMPSSFNKNTIFDSISQSSKELFNKLMTSSGLTIKILAENILEITPKTFIKYKNNETKIPSRIAEMIIEINTLYDLGNEIFGSSDGFNKWLDKPNVIFEGKKPVSFLNTSTGIHYIYEELKRIEFGTTA